MNSVDIDFRSIRGQGAGGFLQEEDRGGVRLHGDRRVLEPRRDRGDRYRGPGRHLGEGGADRGQEEPREAGHGGPEGQGEGAGAPAEEV